VNHEKVKHIGSLLKKHNMKPWIDESHNRDNMLFSIAEGIRKSYFFIVFLTANLNEKIKRGHETKEWCFRELNYAAYKLSPKNVFVVVLEKEMTKRENWADVLLFLFASDVYFDLSGATKSGDGWDYSAAKAWSKLLKKLKEYEMTPVDPQDTESKESNSDDLKGSQTPMLSNTIKDNEFRGFSAHNIWFGLAAVCVVVGFGFYRRNMFRK
jgi:hypothetical protein